MLLVFGLSLVGLIGLRSHSQAAAGDVTIDFERQNDPSGVNVNSVYQTTSTNQPYKDLGLYLRNAYPAITDRVIQQCGANGATEGPIASSGTQYLSPVPNWPQPAGNMELSFSSTSGAVEKVVDNISFDVIGLASQGIRVDLLDHNGTVFSDVLLKNPFGNLRPQASCTSGAWSIKIHVTIDVNTRSFTTNWTYDDPFVPNDGTQEHGSTKLLPVTVENIATLRFVALPEPGPGVTDTQRDGFYALDRLVYSAPEPAPFTLQPVVTRCGVPGVYSGAQLSENVLNWDPVGTATNYLILRNNGVGTPLVQIASQPASTSNGKEIVPVPTTYVDTTPGAGVEYLYQVIAQSPGETKASEIRTIQTIANCNQLTVEIVPDNVMLAPGGAQTYTVISRYNGQVISNTTPGLTFIWSYSSLDSTLPQSAWGSLSDSFTPSPIYRAAATVPVASASFRLMVAASFVSGGVVYNPTDTTNFSVTSASPTLILTANPSSISAGQVSQLSWTSTNTTSCVAAGGWSGTKSLAGNQAVQPSQTTTYSITCTGPAGQVTRQVTVTVIGQSLTVSITPTAVNLRPGQTQQFVAEVRYNGVIVTPTSLTWLVTTPAAGTIDPQTGLFEAGSITASFPLAIRADAAYVGQSAFGRASVNIYTGIQIRGNVSGQAVTGLTFLDPKSIVVGRSLTNLTGERIELPGYEFTDTEEWAGRVAQMRITTSRLVREFGREMSAGRISGIFNLNSPASSSPMSGVTANDFLNPEGGVWVHRGDLVIDQTTFYNRGTIIVLGGDVEINGSLNYGTSDIRKDSFGLIVLDENGLGGNITMKANGQSIIGAYFATGDLRIE